VLPTRFNSSLCRSLFFFSRPFFRRRRAPPPPPPPPPPPSPSLKTTKRKTKMDHYVNRPNKVVEAQRLFQVCW